MAAIDDVIAAVEKVPIADDGSLTLAATDFSGIAIMEAFFASILHAQSYTLRGARRTPGTETITVGGTGDVAGYTGIGVTVTAATGDRGVTVTTPSGTYTKTVDASCADHHCTRDASVTGPNGGTVSRDTRCGASWRFYRCTGTVTGPG